MVLSGSTTRRKEYLSKAAIGELHCFFYVYFVGKGRGWMRMYLLTTASRNHSCNISRVVNSYILGYEQRISRIYLSINDHVDMPAN